MLRGFGVPMGRSGELALGGRSVKFTTAHENRRSLRSRSVLALLPLLFGFPAYAQLQQPPPPLPAAGGESPIAVRSDLVILPVRVTDSDGAFVAGLSRDNFQVFENGREQKIT